MVTFDAQQDGTPATDWDAAVAALDELAIETADRLVVVAAHPDDETLGAGGLIAAFAERGLPVTVIVVTDGAAGGVPGIAERRSDEVRRAVAVLAPQAVVVELGFPDGGVLERRDTVERSLADVLADEPATTLIATPWPGDEHRDHRVVGEATVAAAGDRRVLGYPIWMWHWGAPYPSTFGDEPRALTVDASLKARAMLAYRSQTEGTFPMLRPSFLRHFARDVEVFFELAAGTAAAAAPEPAPAEPEPAPGDAASDRPLAASYFDAIHERRDDPWGFTDRWYEARKRAITLASLPRIRYGTALEIGCSIGVLTADLATRVDDLRAIDVSEVAVERARERVGDRARIELRDAADGLPDGPFDLVVLSEVGYYLRGDALDALLADACAQLGEGGDLVLCHWRHPVDDYPLSGDEVHARMQAVSHGVRLIGRHIEPDFLLDVYSRDERSIAERDGLV